MISLDKQISHQLLRNSLNSLKIRLSV